MSWDDPCVGAYLNLRVCEKGTKSCEVIHGPPQWNHPRCTACNRTYNFETQQPDCPHPRKKTLT